MQSDIKNYKKELDKTNNTIRRLEQTLIKDISKNGIELVNFYFYIEQMNLLTTRKSKLQYLIAVESI